MMLQYKKVVTALAAVLATGVAAPMAHAASFLTGSLSDAANFAVLYEGGGNNNQLSTTNVTVTGNIGIGDPSGTTTAFLAASGPGTINGSVFYAGAVSPNQTVSNTTVTGTITGGNTNVQTDLNNLNSLSSTLGAESGAALSVNLSGTNGSQTINASSGTLDGSGRRVFSVSSFTFNNSNTLTINGSASDLVVFNFPINASFGGTIQLTGGITSDQVLFNVTGGANLTGGHTLQINTNGATETGTFLDPNGSISVVHSVLTGRVFGGDSSNLQIVSGDTLTAPSSGTPVPEPASIFLLLTALVAAGIYRARGFPIRARSSAKGALAG
jgi:hypothetical protein